MISSSDRAKEIHMALIQWRASREAYEHFMLCPSHTGAESRRQLKAIDAAIQRDRLSVIGHYVAKLALEKGPVL